MKRVRVALIGSGKDDDRYRAALPTYNMVEVDYAGMTCIVDVPDDVWPLANTDLPTAFVSDAKLGEVIIGLSGIQKVRAALTFDKRYVEHAGRFVLDVK